MATIMERGDEKRIPPFGRNDKVQGAGDKGTWAAGWAVAGAAVWAGIAVLARVGAIELIFLFAPLVIVPLGMELGRELGGANWLEEAARRVQPLGALCAVVAMWLPPGRKAGLAALGWMVVCGLMAGDGVIRLGMSLWREADRSVRSTLAATLAIARLDLAVGGAWLVASRLGMRPMGIQEPIGLLTAVHFHYAGFATATIAAATLSFAPSFEQKRGAQLWLRRLVWLVIGLPFVVAAGFVISPVLKMAAAVLFSASVAGLAAYVRWCGKRAENATARWLLQVAAGAVFAGMVLSATYAVADFLGSDALIASRMIIPQMARTHGILNSIGFCLPGLLGWLIESSPQFHGSGAQVGE